MDNMPQRFVPPTLHARWVYGEDMEAVTGTTEDSSWMPYIKGEHRHYCSSCRTRAVCGEDAWGYDTEDILTLYCPYCGAKMDADEPEFNPNEESVYTYGNLRFTQEDMERMMELRIPKVVLREKKGSMTQTSCPTCNHEVVLMANCCHHCGQAILWCCCPL